MSKIYAIVGATASGKTALSLALARELNGEIISVDSRQIYYGMDIGTAKEAPRPQPTTDWHQPFTIAGIPHYLIDICTPDHEYTAFDFKEQATYLIEQIQAVGKTPILIGGTTMWMDALLYDYQPGEDSSDASVRQELLDRYDAGEKEQLWQELEKVDPDSAAKIHPNNPSHLVRALEYYLVTGQAKSAAVQKADHPVYEVEFYGLEWEREELYERIRKRIDQQVAAGLLDETERLLSTYTDRPPALTSLGYMELAEYLDGNCELADAVDKFKKNTCQYAKRQLTWLRKNSLIKWLDGKTVASNPTAAAKKIVADSKS